MDKTDNRKTFDVRWSKTYHASGLAQVEAVSAEEAKRIVEDCIGDYGGSMQYDPDKDTVEVL